MHTDAGVGSLPGALTSLEFFTPGDFLPPPPAFVPRAASLEWMQRAALRDRREDDAVQRMMLRVEASRLRGPRPRGEKRPRGDEPVYTWEDAEDQVPSPEEAAVSASASVGSFRQYCTFVARRHDRNRRTHRLLGPELRAHPPEPRVPVPAYILSPPAPFLARRVVREPLDATPEAAQLALREAMDSLVPTAAEAAEAARHAASLGFLSWMVFGAVALTQVEDVFVDPPCVRGGHTDPLWRNARLQETVVAAVYGADTTG